MTVDDLLDKLMRSVEMMEKDKRYSGVIGMPSQQIKLIEVQDIEEDKQVLSSMQEREDNGGLHTEASKSSRARKGYHNKLELPQ